jgi:hypothetical protein
LKEGKFFYGHAIIQKKLIFYIDHLLFPLSGTGGNCREAGFSQPVAPGT